MTSGQKHIVTIIGTRPQFVKAFALSRSFAETPDFRETLVHTGQHYDDNMSAIFFSELNIPPPRYHLSTSGKTHGAMTGQMLEAVETVLLEEKPDAVVVYGDTNSTMAGALAAAKLKIPLAHIEAGLRSYNRAMPEELNRIVTDHLSNILFSPTQIAVDNLAREGIGQPIFLVGDLMYDAMLLVTPIAERTSTILERLDIAPGQYGVATVHRAESTDDPQTLARIFDFIAAQAKERPVVLPLHPRTAAAAAKQGIDPKRHGVLVTDPVGFLDMCRLLRHAAIVITDSGGLQKEAYFHRVPCVTMREETEWVETVTNGWNRLWSNDRYEDRRDIPDYGTGHAAEEITHCLRNCL